MSNVELIRDTDGYGNTTFTLVDPITDTVLIRTTNSVLAERCKKDIETIGYIRIGDN